ncbi:TIGR02680 family protein [Streptomyces sp. NPDC088354]|uniref:TIGR02680 family protein n=1 Tax=Streptomyces sp. NPDC088354 TaxID=3365856 RepID=UPI00381D6802
MPVAASDMLHGLPVPTTERWQPLRAGIVNVFHYDQQTFVFHKGHLLLRGLNGSGKSVALEVLLPYLFDADLSPERLSTFGGRDRSMHWKLIGFDESGRENARGYVWVEFGRLSDSNAPEYFTIGAGLEAIRSDRSKTKAWYWTTRQRIGVELQLTSLQREPHTAAKLADALADNGTVHASPSGYRETVNQTLFGLPDEAYRALRRMLHELRRPHLSQGLDPHKLSDLLSGSLPPVDATVIGQLAAGFDGLDRHAADVRELHTAMEHISALHADYKAYARKFAKSAAVRVRRAHETHEDAIQQQKSAQTELVAAQSLLEEADTALRETRASHEEAGGRLRGLESSEEFRAGRSLDEAEQQAKRAQDMAHRGQERAQASAQRAAETAERTEDVATQLAMAQADADSRAADSLRAAKLVGLDVAVKAVAKKLEQSDLSSAKQALSDAISARRSELAAVTSLLGRATEQDVTVSVLRHRLDAAQQALLDATSDAQRAERAVNEAQGAFTEEVSDWLRAAGTPQELLDESDLSDPDAFGLLLSDLSTQSRATLLTEQSTLTQERQTLLAERQHLRTRFEEVSRGDTASPSGSRTRAGQRQNQAGAPLFLLVDFAPSLPKVLHAGLEAALEASGLLDAWVTPDGRVLPRDVEDVALVHLGPTVTGTSLGDALVPAVSDAVNTEVVARVLAQIAWVAEPTSQLPEGAAATIAGDGRFRVGPLEGRWSKPTGEFIGASARENRQKQAARDLAQQLETLDATLAGVEERHKLVAERLRTLTDELSSAPRSSRLRTAEREVDRTAAVVGERADLVRQVTTALQEALTKLDGDLRAARVAAESTGLTEAQLPEAMRALDVLDEAGREWVHSRRLLAHLSQLAATANVDAASAARDATEDQEKAIVAQNTAREEQARFEAVKNALGTQYAAVMAEIATARDKLNAVAAQERSLQDTRVELTARSRDAASLVKERSKAVSDSEAVLQAAADALVQAASLGLLQVAGVTEHFAAGPSSATDTSPGDVNPQAWSLPEAIAAARGLDSGIGREASSDEALERALNTVTERRFVVERAVSDGIVLRQRSEGGLLVIDTVYQGRALPLHALHTRLQHEAERTASLLESTEQQLFESFLAGQVRREVSQRITMADGIISKINSLMENCPTASTMRLRLAWLPTEEMSTSTTRVMEMLRTPPAELSQADRTTLEMFFRHRIETVRATASSSTWTEQLLKVFDYRLWHRFTLQRQQKDKPWETLTRSKHAAMSGGEKAVALHLPLFAAAAAHYEASGVRSPRLILLDEVFAGVDAPMRGRLFKLACDFDLDMIATSESEQGTHADLNGIAIYQLLRSGNQPGLLAVRSVWDGHDLHRLLDADLAS